MEAKMSFTLFLSLATTYNIYYLVKIKGSIRDNHFRSFQFSIFCLPLTTAPISIFALWCQSKIVI